MTINGETVSDFTFWASKITAYGDCSHKIKRRLFLGRKAMTNLNSNAEKQRHCFANKGPSSQSYGFSNSHGCESWTIKKAEYRRIDAFEPWCWGRLLRVPWTARRSNQSILKEIMRRADSLEKTLSWERLKAGGEGDHRG